MSTPPDNECCGMITMAIAKSDLDAEIPPTYSWTVPPSLIRDLITAMTTMFGEPHVSVMTEESIKVRTDALTSWARRAGK